MTFDLGEGSQKEGVKWYRLAAEQGHLEAQSELGICYANGWGVTRDLVEAYVWHTLAGEQGHVMADYFMETLRDQLTQAQIAKAEKTQR